MELSVSSSTQQSFPNHLHHQLHFPPHAHQINHLQDLHILHHAHQINQLVNRQCFLQVQEKGPKLLHCLFYPNRNSNSTNLTLEHAIANGCNRMV